jgi:MFS family permease
LRSGKLRQIFPIPAHFTERHPWQGHPLGQIVVAIPEKDADDGAETLRVFDRPANFSKPIEPHAAHSNTARAVFKAVCTRWTEAEWAGIFWGDEGIIINMSQFPPVHRGITSRTLKSAVYVLEGLNAVSTTLFFFYLYFYTKAQFKFGALQNLLLAACLGYVYSLGAFLSGRIAQRFGYFAAVRLGIATMFTAFLACSQTTSVGVTIGLAVVGNVGMCLTWPALEALVSEGEPPARLQGLLGVYNVVWATAAAAAFFSGGALLEHWGLKTMFYLPAGFLLVELIIASWLQRAVHDEPPAAPEEAHPVLHAASESYRSPVSPATFLSMAWLANPMAYLTINTIISIVPTLAERLSFSPKLAGFICSIWLFTRAMAFAGLRLWPGWHYRFRFLAWAYVAMVVSFGAMLLVPDWRVLVVSEAILGAAVGLIYYSSLFYSMDVGETKGEHGGIHEAVIGLGSGTGPAMAALALTLFPHHPGSGAWGVCVVLVLGLAALFRIRFRNQS